jgi:hypothetical protein
VTDEFRRIDDASINRDLLSSEYGHEGMAGAVPAASDGITLGVDTTGNASLVCGGLMPCTRTARDASTLNGHG